MDRKTSQTSNVVGSHESKGSTSPTTVHAESLALLARAATELKILEKQAELARVETRKLELLTAIQSAERGDPRPLRVWLETNGRHLAVDPEHKTVDPEHKTVAPEHKSVDPELKVVDPSELVSAPGWDKFQKRSLQRLAALHPAPGSPLKTDSQSTSQASKLAAQASQRKLSIPKVDVPAQANGGSRQLATKRRWQLRGILVSTLVHGLLLIALGVITITVPISTSIFELQAMDSNETAIESFELTTPVEVESPSEPVDLAADQWQPDLADSLAVPEQTLASTLGDLANQAEASSGISQALAATASQSPKNLSASFFGASATGNCFCFLIDGSATLRGAPWQAARAELLKSLSSLSDKQRFYVIFYNQVVSKLPDPESGESASSPIYATPENLQHAARWLQTLRVDTAPAGGNHTTVLQAALDLEPDAIFLLTDGEMTPGVERAVLRMLETQNRVQDIIAGSSIRTPIHTIAFHSLQGVSVMQKIAEQNLGQMKFVPKAP